MDRLMRGFTGGADAASQGIQGAVGMLAQQKQLQDKMAFETSQAQAKMEADQAAAKEKRAFDEQMARRREDFDAADKGLRRRIVTEPNQQEFGHASQDVSARIKDNPVTNLFDSGLTGLVPAGVMTALEGGSVMNDPNNQARLMTQSEGWERDPAWKDPKAKPPTPPPTALDPKRMQWFDTEARQKTIKPPALSQIERLLSLVSDPNTPPEQQMAAQQQLAQVDQKHWEQVNQQYEAAVMNAKVRLMGEQVAGGAPDSPFLERAIAGLQSKYGPQPWSPGEGDVTEPEPFAPPMAAGDEPGDVGDIDADDENIPLETRIQALGGGGAPAQPAPAPPMQPAPQGPQAQWLPGGDAQLANGMMQPPPSRAMSAPLQQLPSSVMGRPPQPDAVDLAVDRDVMEAEQQGLTVDDLLERDSPEPGPVDPFAGADQSPSAVEQVGAGGVYDAMEQVGQQPAGYTPGKPFQDPGFEKGLMDLMRRDSANQPIVDQGASPSSDYAPPPMPPQDPRIGRKTQVGPLSMPAYGPSTPIQDALIDPFMDRSGNLTDLGKYGPAIGGAMALAPFAKGLLNQAPSAPSSDDALSALASATFGAAESSPAAAAGLPDTSVEQPTIGIMRQDQSQEVPLVHVAPGIDLAEPAAQSFSELLNDPNMTPQWRQILLRPGQPGDRAFRTMDRQQEMRDDWQAGNTNGITAQDGPGPPTHKAGAHTSGSALDLGDEIPWMLKELLHQHGWVQNVANDPTHWGFKQ
jgi:hypothetical protein